MSEDKKRISGSDLDLYIESELLAMEREGLDKSPIKASTLHARLKAKGIVSGGLSTLSPSHRKEMIEKYQKSQHRLSNLNEEEMNLLAGRRTGAAYISRAKRMEKERDEMKDKYEQNLFAVLDIIKTVQVSSPIKVEDLLSPHLIRELRKSSGKNG